MSKIHIIAEAGTNHNGNRKVAEDLVDIALNANADSVKFQIIYPEGLYLPKIIEQDQIVNNDVYHQRERNMLSDDDYRAIAQFAGDKGIPFSASIFDLMGLNLLDELNVPYIKIASCDLNNSKFLMEVAERKRKIVLSTGMASLGEIERAIIDIYSQGHLDVVLMHCVSIYPSPVERMNLSFIDVLEKSFGLDVGLSDHTESSLAAAIAVSKGVTWIEKHFTLDRNAPGFDHAYAMEPSAMSSYISEVRKCEEACKIQIQKVSELEQNVKIRARRGIYAARNLMEGQEINELDLLVVRPESPLEPNDASLLLGRRLNRPVSKFESLSLDMF